MDPYTRRLATLLFRAPEQPHVADTGSRQPCCDAAHSADSKRQSWTTRNFPFARVVVFVSGDPRGTPNDNGKSLDCKFGRCGALFGLSVQPHPVPFWQNNIVIAAEEPASANSEVDT